MLPSELVIETLSYGDSGWVLLLELCSMIILVISFTLEINSYFADIFISLFVFSHISTHKSKIFFVQVNIS